MNYELEGFNYKGNKVRFVKDENGEPQWLEKDVCNVVRYDSDVSTMVRHVPEQLKTLLSVNTVTGIRKMIMLSEDGLYYFLSRSHKPAALPLLKWLEAAVFPSIRNKGTYSFKGMLPKFASKASHNTYLDALKTLIAEIEAKEALQNKCAPPIRKTKAYSAVVMPESPSKAAREWADEFEKQEAEKKVAERKLTPAPTYSDALRAHADSLEKMEAAKRQLSTGGRRLPVRRHSNLLTPAQQSN